MYTNSKAKILRHEMRLRLSRLDPVMESARPGKCSTHVLWLAPPPPPPPPPGTADTAHESPASLSVASPFFRPSTPGSRYSRQDRHQRGRLACLPSTGAREEERFGAAANHTRRRSRRTSANTGRTPPPQDRFCNTSCCESGNRICCFAVATSLSGSLF